MAAAVLSIVACAPQIRRLILTKNSDSFSAPTWIMWASTQVATLAYVISIQAVLMIIVNIVWVSFYGMMTVLILHYQMKRPQLSEVDLVQAVAAPEQQA